MPRRGLLYDAEIVARVELDRLLCVADCHVVDTHERLLSIGLVITLEAVDRAVHLICSARYHLRRLFDGVSLDRSFCGFTGIHIKLRYRHGIMMWHLCIEL